MPDAKAPMSSGDERTPGATKGGGLFKAASRELARVVNCGQMLPDRCAEVERFFRGICLHFSGKGVLIIRTESSLIARTRRTDVRACARHDPAKMGTCHLHTLLNSASYRTRNRESTDMGKKHSVWIILKSNQPRILFQVRKLKLQSLAARKRKRHCTGGAAAKGFLLSKASK